MKRRAEMAAQVAQRGKGDYLFRGQLQDMRAMQVL